MGGLHRIGISLLLAALAVSFSASASSASRQSRVPLRDRPVRFPEIHPRPDDTCKDLSGGAFALCDVFCNILRCDRASSPTCEVVRRNWQRLTFRSQLPCELLPPTPTATLTRTATPSPTLTFTPTTTPTRTATRTNSATPTFTAEPEDTPTGTAVPTSSSTATETEEPEDTPTATPTETGVPTGTATATFTEEPEDTPTATLVPTSTVTATFTEDAEDTPTATPTATGIPTGTAMATSTATVTETSLPSNTSTSTATPSSTHTATASATATSTATQTPVATATSTSTATQTPMATSTATSTATATATASVTATATGTATSTATSTATATVTPTPTETAVVCPIDPGAYTLTQVSGGNLRVDGLPAFPFPQGGSIIQDVGSGDGDCVHETIVPFPGGFSAPAFCIPALGFTTSVVQTGCGIGRIDSDGGSDFTIVEIGDTSSPNTCGLPHPSCTSGADSNVQVDLTVGDGTPDTCSTGTANATVSVPVFTTTWLRIAMCPDPDGTYNPGADILVVSFPQTLDFTTDSTLGDWADLDPDNCCIAGAGPASVSNPCIPSGGSGLGATGTCLDLTGVGQPGVDVTTVAAGAIGSSGSPLYDLTFVTTLPNQIAGPAAPLGATCASPPSVEYGGTVTRCIGQGAATVTNGRALRPRKNRGLPLFSPSATAAEPQRRRRSRGH